MTTLSSARRSLSAPFRQHAIEYQLAQVRRAISPHVGEDRGACRRRGRVARTPKTCAKAAPPPRRPRLVVLPGWALHRTRVLERPSGTNSTGTPDASRSAAAGVVEWWDSALCGHGRHGARPTHRGPAAEAMVVRRVPAHRR